MKTPENLLPLSVMKDGFSRTGIKRPHCIYSAKEDLIMLADVHQDHLIAHESSNYNSFEVAQYLCEAANKFPKAIDLLKLCKRELHQFYNTDESQALSETETFLKETENEDKTESDWIKLKSICADPNKWIEMYKHYQDLLIKEDTISFWKDQFDIANKEREELKLKLNQANKLLDKAVRFMNLVPNKKYDNHYPLCSQIDKFLK